MENLVTVHKALQEAVVEKFNPTDNVTQTFRINKELKDQCDQICEQNGTTISAFLRMCCMGLVVDYVAPIVPAEDEIL